MLTPESSGKYFQRNIKYTDGCRYAVRSFGSLELSQRQCCLQGKISWLTSQNKNITEVERMPMEDSNLPTLHLN